MPPTSNRPPLDLVYDRPAHSRRSERRVGAKRRASPALGLESPPTKRLRYYRSEDEHEEVLDEGEPGNTEGNLHLLEHRNDQQTMSVMVKLRIRPKAAVRKRVRHPPLATYSHLPDQLIPSDLRNTGDQFPRVTLWNDTERRIEPRPVSLVSLELALRRNPALSQYVGQDGGAFPRRFIGRMLPEKDVNAWEAELQKPGLDRKLVMLNLDELCFVPFDHSVDLSDLVKLIREQDSKLAMTQNNRVYGGRLTDFHGLNEIRQYIESIESQGPEAACPKRQDFPVESSVQRNDSQNASLEGRPTELSSPPEASGACDRAPELGFSKSPAKKDEFKETPEQRLVQHGDEVGITDKTLASRKRPCVDFTGKCEEPPGAQEGARTTPRTKKEESATKRCRIEMPASQRCVHREKDQGDGSRADSPISVRLECPVLMLSESKQRRDGTSLSKIVTDVFGSDAEEEDDHCQCHDAPVSKESPNMSPHLDERNKPETRSPRSELVASSQVSSPMWPRRRIWKFAANRNSELDDSPSADIVDVTEISDEKDGDFATLSREALGKSRQRHAKHTSAVEAAYNKQLHQRMRTRHYRPEQASLNRNHERGEALHANELQAPLKRRCRLAGSMKAMAAKQIHGHGRTASPAGYDNPPRESAPHSAYVYLWNYDDGTRSPHVVPIAEAVSACKGTSIAIYDGQDFGFRNANVTSRVNIFEYDIPKWERRDVSFNRRQQKVRVWDPSRKCIRRYLYCPSANYVASWLCANPDYAVFVPSMLVLSGRKIARAKSEKVGFPGVFPRPQEQLVSVLRTSLIAITRELKFAGLNSHGKMSPTFWNTFKGCKEIRAPFFSKSELYKFWLSNPWLEIYRGQDELAKLEATNGIELIPIMTSCPARLATFWDTVAKKRVVQPRGVPFDGKTVVECLSNDTKLKLYRGQDTEHQEVINRKINHDSVHGVLLHNYMLAEKRTSVQSFLNSGSWTALYIDVRDCSPATAVFWSRFKKNVLMQPTMNSHISIEEYLRENAGSLELYTGQDLTEEVRQDLSAWFELLKWRQGYSSKHSQALITKKCFLYEGLASKFSCRTNVSLHTERPIDVKSTQEHKGCGIRNNTGTTLPQNEQECLPKDIKIDLNHQNPKSGLETILQESGKRSKAPKDSSTTLDVESRKTDILADKDEYSLRRRDAGNEAKSDTLEHGHKDIKRCTGAPEKCVVLPDARHEKLKDVREVGDMAEEKPEGVHIDGQTIPGAKVGKEKSNGGVAEERDGVASEPKDVVAPILMNTADDTKRRDVGLETAVIKDDPCCPERNMTSVQNHIRPLDVMRDKIEDDQPQSLKESNSTQKQISLRTETKQHSTKEDIPQAKKERIAAPSRLRSGSLKTRVQEMSIESTSYSDENPRQGAGRPDAPTSGSSTVEQPFEEGESDDGESSSGEDMAGHVMETNDPSEVLLMTSRLSKARKEADKVANLIETAGPLVLQRQLVQDIRQGLREDLLLEVSDSAALVALADRVRSPDFLRAAEALCGCLEALDGLRCFTNTADFDYGPPDICSLREKLTSGKIFTIAEVIEAFKVICGDLLQFHEGSIMQYEALHLKNSGDGAIAKFVSRNQRLLDEEKRIIRISNICRRAEKIGFREKERSEKTRRSANPKSPGHGKPTMRVSGYQSEVTYLNYRDEKGYSVMGKRHSARVFGLSIDRETCEKRIGNARPCHVCKKELFRSGGDSLQCANYSVGLCSNMVCRECLELVFMLDGAEFIKRRKLDDWICVQCRGLCYEGSREGSGCESTELGKEQSVDSSLTWPYSGSEATSVTFRLIRASSRGEFVTDWKKGREVRLRREEEKWRAVVVLRAGVYRCQVVVNRSAFASTVLHVLTTEKYRKELERIVFQPGVSEKPRDSGQEPTRRGLQRTKWSISNNFANGPVHSFSEGDGGKLVENCCRTEGYDWRRSKRHAVVKWVPENLRRTGEGSEDNEGGTQIVRLSATIQRMPRAFESAEFPKLEPGMSRATFERALVAFKFDYMFNETLCGIVTGKSDIHGIGLFTLTGYQKGDFVIEYAGDLIRTPLADIREKRYEAAGLGTYLFRINDHKIVDATVKSNRARFTNHSCDPNMEADIVNVRGRDLIVLIATRDIPPYSELTFNYQLPYEDKKLQCLCNSWNCIGVMN